METKNRNLWIILIVILVVLCICFAAVCAIVGGLAAVRSIEVGMGAFRERESSERTFEVGDAPSLQIENFAGSVNVRAGERGVIRVVITKLAPGKGDLERIGVEMTRREGGVLIKTSKPLTLNNASVGLEITTPPGTSIDAQTGAGSIEIEAVNGQVRLQTGAGSIEYEGTLSGDCRFETGAGSIKLKLPSDLKMRVDLETGAGSIDLDFTVDGQKTRQKVRGVIGDGSQGSIYAHSGAGSIDINRR